MLYHQPTRNGHHRVDHFYPLGECKSQIRAHKRTDLAALPRDVVLADLVRLRHDLDASSLVVQQLVAVHLAVDTVLHVAYLVAAQPDAGARAAHDLVIPDDAPVGTAVNPCGFNPRQHESRTTVSIDIRSLPPFVTFLFYRTQQCRGKVERDFCQESTRGQLQCGFSNTGLILPQ